MWNWYRMNITKNYEKQIESKSILLALSLKFNYHANRKVKIEFLMIY